MKQMYQDPEREHDQHALPNAEVFRVTAMEAAYNLANLDHADEFTIVQPGWYWWSVFPGCLPDGPAIGPYETEAEALADCLES